MEREGLITSLCVVAISSFGFCCGTVDRDRGYVEADSDAATDADTDADTDTDIDSDAGADGDSDGDADTDSDADADSDSDGDADGDTDSDTDGDGDTGPMCPPTPCPTPPDGYALDDPMVAVDRCAFPMQDQDTWAAQGALIEELANSLPVVTVQDVLLDLDRQGSWVDATSLASGEDVPGVQWAFAWNSDDLDVAYWIPQGLTGSPDADASGLVGGKRVVIATWYYSAAKDPLSPGDKGVRISLADVTDSDDTDPGDTDPGNPSYQLLLLVEPYHDSERANFRGVDCHAGGAVWFGQYLYVVDTSNGFRVFDLSRILRVETVRDTIGYSAVDLAYYAYKYKYVVPQIGTYQHASACSPRYSFVGLDRSASTPSLISGEYDADSAAGRVYRWPLDETTHRLPSGKFYPEEAYYMGYSHVQGAVAHNDDFFLSSSEPPSGRGALATSSESGFGQVIPWIDGPEDLVYDLHTHQLWGLGEHSPRRYVFAADVLETGL